VIPLSPNQPSRYVLHTSNFKENVSHAAVKTDRENIYPGRLHICGEKTGTGRKCDSI
jgi:hypothetical protein